MALRFAFVAPLLVVALGACASSAKGTTDTDELNETPPTASSTSRASYAFVLQARSSEDPADPTGTYLVPPGASAKDASPSINDNGDVAIDLITADDIEHVFAGGKVRFSGPDPDATISGTSINEAGDVVFDVWNGASGNGVYTYSAKTGEATFLSAEPLGAESWGNVSNRPSNGKIGVRPSGASQRYLGYLDANGFTKLAVEKGTSPSSPYTYIFGPEFDRAGRAAMKMQLASGGNDIRILAPGADPIIVAQDHDANAASSYASLDNGVGFNDVGQVAFVAKVGPARGVYLSDGTTTKTIATEGANDVAQITYFTPVVNDAGTVVFRGMDTKGANVIWVSDGTTLQRVASTGDVLPSDKGDAAAVPEIDYDPSNVTVFGGGLAINAKGQIAFLAAIATSVDHTKRLGTALYVASPR
jgi:hypothetical protein